jgi:hypothetical protein
MAVQEITDKSLIQSILGGEPLRFVEALDENARGVEGIVSVFAEADSGTAPPNALVVRWAQSALGLRHAAELHAGRVGGLEDVLSALPADRGPLDLALPFWASAAVAQSFRAEPTGAEALYLLPPGVLRASPVSRQATRVTETYALRAKFRKLAEEAPAYVLSLKGALQAVAVVTHLRPPYARIDVYTIEESRRRGFGRGMLTALAEELLASGLVPTLRIDLSDERAVRLVEAAGFVQRSSALRLRLTGAAPERSPGLLPIR